MIEYLIRLQIAMGVGSSRAIKALNTFGNVENIFKASSKEREASKIFTKIELKRLNTDTTLLVRDIIADCKKFKINIIPIYSKSYPKCLREIENPPLVLYVKGELPDFESLPVICVVGPREVSEYGKKSAYAISYRLAKAGFIIVSGGAKGSDYYAHLGALRAEGKTVLVMACGIECGYLPQNQRLRDYVAQNGCIISEYPPLIKPTKYSFPVRNRIMSALSLGTVVIEAGKKSGALITANHAAEQGKDVFVIPGTPNAKEYAGSNALLRDGAKPLLDLSDILNEYIPVFPEKINVARAYEEIKKVSPKPSENEENKSRKPEISKEKTEINKNLSIETLSNEAKIVYNCIDKHKFYPEEIKTDKLTASQILSALTELEIEMLIHSLPGGCYEINE